MELKKVSVSLLIFAYDLCYKGTCFTNLKTRTLVLSPEKINLLDNFSRREISFINPYRVLAVWPTDIPVVAWLCHAKNKVILITAGAKISENNLSSIAWRKDTEQENWRTGSYSRQIILGAASYDDLKMGVRSDDFRSSIFYCGFSFLEWDLAELKCFHWETKELCHPEFLVNAVELKKCFSLAESQNFGDFDHNKYKWQLWPHSDERKYLDTVKTIKDDIRRGRYYQLNFLRYFGAAPHEQNENNRPSLAQKMYLASPPYGFWLEDKQHFIFSMSPERFISITPENNSLSLNAYPIKGTQARHESPSQDQNLALKLLKSEKDLSELHIIVDLLRNDMHPLCLRRSVNVISSHHMRSSRHVHHLEAKISGTLTSPCYFTDLLKYLCPSGSVTGAPKKEVMVAIEQYEQRKRHFFMGNGFYFSLQGELHSSVLIRTLYRSFLEQDKYEFAAGSGITIGSDPKQEYQEILTKCRILIN